MSSFNKLLNLRKSPVAQSIGIYTFTNFFGKGISFLLLFIYTNPKFITPSENGLLSLLGNSIIFLMPFVSMGILQSTSTDFFKLDKKEFKDFFTTGFLMPVIVSILSVIILFFLKDYLKGTYGFPYKFIWIIPVITFFTFTYEQLISLIRNNSEPLLFFKVNISKTVLELGLSVILVVFFAWRWKGRVVGIVTAYLITGIYAFYYFIKKGYLIGKFKKAYICSELMYAIPIISMQACVFTMSASDKFFLSNFTNDNNKTVGIYSVACLFGSVITILCTAYLQYLFPEIYAMLSSDTIDYKSIKKHFYAYAMVMTGGAVIIMALTPFLYNYFINPQYQPALHYIYFLGAGYFLWAVTYYFYSFLLFYKQKKKILFLSLTNIFITLGCNYFFIKRWNAPGAATAVFISYFISLLITLISVRSYIAKIFFEKTLSTINNERTDL